MAVRKAPEEFQTMTFGQHLDELRRRLIYALLGLGVSLAVTLYYGRTLISIIYAPLATVQRLADLNPQLYTRSPLAGFGVYMKVSLIAALILAAPWMLYQVWKFIEAGLYQSERRAALSLMVLSSIMTGLALLFLYCVLLPAALSFLIFWTTSYPIPNTEGHGYLDWITKRFMVMNDKTFFFLDHGKAATTVPSTLPSTSTPLALQVLDGDPANPIQGQIWYNQLLNEMRFYQGGKVHVVTVTAESSMVPMIDPNDYLSEVAGFALIVVVIFHVPVVMAFLGMAGIGNAEWLAKRRRVVIFGLFVAAIFFTPSQDAFSNVALPVVAWGLFELGLLLMRYFARRRARLMDQEMAD